MDYVKTLEQLERILKEETSAAALELRRAVASRVLDELPHVTVRVPEVTDPHSDGSRAHAHRAGVRSIHFILPLLWFDVPTEQERGGK